MRPYAGAAPPPWMRRLDLFAPPGGRGERLYAIFMGRCRSARGWVRHMVTLAFSQMADYWRRPAVVRGTDGIY